MPTSCDKLLKNKKGEYVNVLMDQLMLSKKNLNYLSMEIPNNFDYKDPSFVKRDLGTLGLLIPYKLLYLVIRYSNRYGKRAALIAGELELFLKQKGIDYRVDVKEIKKYLDAYSAEYNVYSFLLTCIKPKAVFVADQGAFGKIGAFLNHKVEVIEVQHGMLEEYTPHYVYPESIRIRKNQLVIPDKICVFGEFHARILLRHGYWKKNELICLGNYRLDSWRKVKNGHRDARFTILFPTQWHVFEETKIAFREILKYSEGALIMIKIHPGEKENHLEYYKELQQQYPETVKLWDKSKDIYELIVAADLVISFDSTTLLEGLALGKPGVSISTEVAPEGIHTYMNTIELKDVIKVARNEQDLSVFIKKIRNDREYRQHWENESLKLGEYLYSYDYEKNCLDLITSLSQ